MLAGSGYNSTEAVSVRDRATALLELHRRAEKWRQSAEEARSVDPAKLRDLTRQCRNLVGAAMRPTTVGVFGESQFGKSYLVSCFAGAETDLLVQEPGLTLTGEVDSSKWWAESAKKDGGISFIKWINAESGLESTALACRVTRHPYDKPQRDNAFAARVLSHEDLLASLAMGYCAEVQLGDTEELGKQMAKVIAEVAEQPKRQGPAPELEDLEAVMGFLTEHYNDAPYVGALIKAGFVECISDFLRAKTTPHGVAWDRFAGLLWGFGRNPALDDLYRRLRRHLLDMESPDLCDIDTAAVLKRASRESDKGQMPLTDVGLLKGMWSDTQKITVWFRKEGAASGREHALTRPELSALVLELVLPLAGGREDRPSLLDEADILDFPGARSDKMQTPAMPDGETARQEGAVAVFRRGKLTRLFCALAEKLEISLLCLAVAPRPLEAPAVVRRLLGTWFRHQPKGTKPDLFAAMTLSDLTIDRYRVAQFSAGKGGLGEIVGEMKQSYSPGLDESNWMENHGQSKAKFQDVYFVYNKNKSKIFKNDIDDARETIESHYSSDPRIAAFVGNAPAKLRSLLSGDGGIGMFTTDMLDRVHIHGKTARLAQDLENKRAGLLAALQNAYVEVDPRKQPDPEGLAAEHVAKLEQLNRALHGSGRNAVALFLEHLRLDARTAGAVFDKLERLHGQASEEGGALTMSCARFIQGLREEWSGVVARRMSEADRTKFPPVPPEFLVLLGSQWMKGVSQLWMTDAMERALNPYFDAPAGATRIKAGVIAAAVWTWNRELVNLGASPKEPDPVALPPKLSLAGTSASQWVLDHWRKRLPIIYAGGSPPPPGNEELGTVIVDLHMLEAVR